jgi:hypothetical protein
MTKLLSIAVFLLLVACGGAPAKEPVKPEVPDTTPPDTTPPEVTPDTPATFKAGPDGFPLPLDADDGTPVPEGGGKLTVFKVPRGKTVVADELKATVIADGWTIDAEEVSPRGAIRLDISKDGKSFKARMTGDDTQTALILTVP